MNTPVPLSVTYPGGCFIGFNALIDRKAAEQLLFVVADAKRNGFQEVSLCLSSFGGFTDQAYYAFNILDGLDLKLVTYNVGTIQSAANLLFLAADERYATDGSTFFFHKTSFDASAGQRITEGFITEKLKAMQYDDARSAEIMARKTGQPIEQVRGWQDTELVMTAEDAIENGLDEAIKPLTIPKNAFFHQVAVP